MGLSIEEKEIRKAKRRKEKFKREHRLIDRVDYKFCNTHDKYFPNETPWIPATLDYFYKNITNGIDGLGTRCKKCEIIRAGINQIENRDRAYEQHSKYRKTDKYIQWGRKHGKQQRESGYNLNWQRKNPEKVRYYSSLHRIHDVSTKEEQGMLKVFNYQCAYCGMTLEEHKKKFGEKLHNDHVDNEGYNDLRNDVPACKSCNCSKHTSIMEEWYKKQDFYTEERYNKIIWWLTEGYLGYIEEKPPYRITKRRVDNGSGKYHYVFELWSVDEKRNMIELLNTKSKKKYLETAIKEHYNILSNDLLTNQQTTNIIVNKKYNLEIHGKE